jgi:hypothetical protein
MNFLLLRETLIRIIGETPFARSISNGTATRRQDTARRARQSQGNGRKAGSTFQYQSFKLLGGVPLDARVCSRRQQVDDA